MTKQNGIALFLILLACNGLTGQETKNPAAGPQITEGVQASGRDSFRHAEAIRLFGRHDDDRARVYVNAGSPDSRVVLDCPDSFRALELWTYLQHPKLGPNSQLIFFPEPGTGVFRYWTILDGESVLLSPKAQGRNLLEINETACPGMPALKHAFKAISTRQGDNVKALAERQAVTFDPLAGIAGESAQPPVPSLVSNKPLSAKERKTLASSLPAKYKQFLEDVEPIIADLERDTFLRLNSDYQRDRFIDNFWKRRSITSDGLRTPFRDVYEMRLSLVKEKYRGAHTDQGRIYLINGPPDGVKRIDCQDVFWPIEIWYYERLESVRLTKVILLFYVPFGAGDYKLWTPLDGQYAVQAGGIAGMTAAAPAVRVDFTRCPDWRDVFSAMSTVAAQMGTATSMKFVDELKQGPKTDVEGVDSILQLTTDIDPAAARLAVQRLIRFPEQVGNKIRMELGLLLEKEALAKKTIAEETFIDLDVVGEMVRDGRLAENFRYRFDFPLSTVNGPFVPVTVERDLYPGQYKLRVKVADANQNAAALVDETITVPEVPDVTLPAEEKAAREAARATVAKLVANPDLGKGSISLLPIAREFATGLIRFETRVSSLDIAYVEFYLNNTKVVTKRRPPFDADLDLGELPRRHSIKVIAYSKESRPLAEDEMVLNEGREAFRIRIVSPAKGIMLEGPVRVVADVAIPESKKLKAVEFYVNEYRAAVLFQGPFSQLVDIPKSRDLGFLRVVALLEDGDTTEDIRYFNAPKYLSEVDVQAVELFTSVFEKGRPVTGLTREAFTVLEDGVPQTIDGFEVVSNLPLTLGIGMDVSGSMEEALVEAQKAASGFVNTVMTKKDRCFLVSFDTEPQLVLRLTSEKSRLTHAMAGLRAHGSTALWDAVVYGLYQYQGMKGRKAYVILTDGEDRASKFTYEAALDYARKAGVALYFIGLRIKGTALDVKSKLNRLARETGGATYYIDAARNLAGIYKEIEEELRSQYLLTYIPPAKPGSDKWRKVDVKVRPDNLTARTISGYYP